MCAVRIISGTAVPGILRTYPDHKHSPYASTCMRERKSEAVEIREGVCLYLEVMIKKNRGLHVALPRVGNIYNITYQRVHTV